MKYFFSKYKVYISLASIIIIYFISLILSKGVLLGGDDIQHYTMARYAFKYPELFFNGWGKPIFTLLSAPFAQLGFTGSSIFSIIASLIAVYFSYKIAEKLELKNSYLVIFFVAFSPMFLRLAISGMTENLFAAAIVLAIYLFLSKKYYASIILVSFFPFFRQEGYMIMFLFLITLIVKKEFKYILLLPIGYIVYSIAGYFVFDDILWLINTKTYGFGNKYPVEGDFFFFLLKYKEIIGIPITIFFLLGVLFMLIKVFNIKNWKKDKFLAEEFFLISGSLLAILLFHSYVFWAGTFSAIGSTRLMAQITPLVAIVSFFGLHSITKFIKNSTYNYIIYGALTFIIVYTSFKIAAVPYKISPEQEITQEVAEWFNNSEYKNYKLHYKSPYLGYLLNDNPYDTTTSNTNGYHFGYNVSSDYIIFWDSHFAAVEGDTPIEDLIKDPNYKLIKTFMPKIPFTSFGKNFAYYILKKRELGDKSESKYTELYYENFEDKNSKLLKENYSDKYALSGKKSYKLNNKREYDCSNTIDMDIIKKNTSFVLNIDFSLYNDKLETDINTIVVASIVDGDKHLLYNKLYFKSSNLETNKWNNINFSWIVPSDDYSGKKLKIYFWQRDKNTYYIDDLRISITNLD